jgi:hypothetical protein
MFIVDRIGAGEYTYDGNLGAGNDWIRYASVTHC